MELIGVSPSKSILTGERNFKNCYEEVEIISKNEIQTTNLVRDLNSGQYLVARKVSTASLSKKQRQQLTNQLNMLQNLRHPNIVKLREIIKEKDGDSEVIYAVEEYCEEGDLAHHIRRQRAKGQWFSQEIIESWVMQIILALEYIHTHKVVHRNLMPKNVFLTASGNVKIGSFSASKSLSIENFATTFVGCPNYVSPEIIEGKKYDYKTDIWSLGCIFFQLCALQPPFESSNILQMASKITKGLSEDRVPSHYTKNIHDLIRKCMSKRPQDRPSARQLLKSDTFLNVMQRFLITNGKISQKQQKIPIKKYKVHEEKKVKRPISGLPRTNSKKKTESNSVIPSPNLHQPKSEKKPSIKKQQSKLEVRTPVLSGKQPADKVQRKSKEIKRSNSQDRKRSSIEKMKKLLPQKPPATPPNLAKVQGKKMVVPSIPKPATTAKKTTFVRSQQLHQNVEQVTRSVQSQIKSPEKETEPEQQTEMSQPETNQSVREQIQKNWMDQQQIDYTLSMTRKAVNLANQLQGFKKKQPIIQTNDRPLSGVFDGLPIRVEQELDQEDANNRLTNADDEIPELLTHYRTKLEQFVQDVNFRYGPNMQIIVEKTNDFGSDQFAKNKIDPS